MDAKEVPKFLVGTAQIGLETTLVTSSGLVGPKDAFTGLSAPHFDLLFSPFGRQFQCLAAILTLPPLYIWLTKFISQSV